LKLAGPPPECPECGRRFRDADSRRCSACGEGYAGSGYGVRRWAVGRLPWDRRRRGLLLAQFLTTSLRIVFCPLFAARRIAAADRGWRAARWAAIHVFAATLIATLCCNDFLFSSWILRELGIVRAADALHFMDRPPPDARLPVWLVQSFVAWLLMFGSVPALGAGLALMIPQRRSWQFCAQKWSAYATVVLVPAVGLWYFWYTLAPPVYQVPASLTILRAGPAPDFDATAAGAVYGAYWALGLCRVAGGRFLGLIPGRGAARGSLRKGALARLGTLLRRSLTVRAASLACVFVTAWWLVRAVVLPGGGLEALR